MFPLAFQERAGVRLPFFTLSSQERVGVRFPLKNAVTARLSSKI